MPAPSPYRRDRVTWTGYALIGVWAFFLYFIGPAASAIGDELELRDVAQGLLGTALAVGLAGSAILGPRAVLRWGRPGALLRVLAGMTGAAVLLAVAMSYPIVLLAVAGLGLLGATAANTATAMLSDHHPDHRARAITEGNAAASWLGVAAPVALGFFLTLPTGWRGAAVLVGLLPLAAVVAVRRLPGQSGRPAVSSLHRRTGAARSRAGETGRAAGVPQTASDPLPRVFWPALLAVGMAVALEFTVNFWAASLIGERTGADLAAAAGALAAMTFGMALGRTFLAGLASRLPVALLIVVFFLIASAGLAALLWSGTLALAVMSLFVTGLGLSVLFPFAQATAIGLALGNTDRAVALTALAIGLAIGGGAVPARHPGGGDRLDRCAGRRVRPGGDGHRGDRRRRRAGAWRVRRLSATGR